MTPATRACARWRVAGTADARVRGCVAGTVVRARAGWGSYARAGWRSYARVAGPGCRPDAYAVAAAAALPAARPEKTQPPRKVPSRER
ncbi:hypothetical protein GCM10017562_17060 [Streptomyces roseofulvus]